MSEPRALVVQSVSQLAVYGLGWGILGPNKSFLIRTQETRRVTDKPKPKSTMVAWSLSSENPMRSGGLESMY